MKRTIWAFLLLSIMVSHFAAADTLAGLEKKLQSLSGRERLPLLKQLGSKQWLLSGERYLAIGREIKAIAQASGEKQEEAFALRVMALGHTGVGQFEKALELYFESRFMENKSQNIEGAAEANSEIGNLMYFCFGNYPKAIEYYGKALEQYRKLRHPYGIAKHLNNQAEVFLVTGEYEKATKIYLQALRQIEEAPQAMPEVKAVILSNLCSVNLHLGNVETAWQYLNDASTMKEVKSYGIRIVLEMLRGSLLQMEGKYKQALSQFEKGLAMIRSAPGSPSHLAQSRLVADVYRAMGEVYMQMGNTSSAIHYLQKAVALNQEIRNLHGMARAQLYLARAYWQAGDRNAALRSALENEALCQKHHFFIELGELFHDLYNWFSEMGNNQNTLLYRQREEEVKKSIHEPRMAANVLAILMKYEHERMGLEVENLRNRRMLIFFISFLTIAIISSASIFYIRHVRRRSKLAMQATERELQGEHRSQLEVLKTRLKEMESQDAQKKYHKSSLSRQEAHYFLKQLIEIMEKEKPFLDSDLTLDHLANKLNINRSYLSQVINECGEKSFNDFINGFRVEEAKRLLLKTDEKDCSNLQIGFKVGFNSKSTFYFVFKKHTGLTPSEFQQRFPPS